MKKSFFVLVMLIVSITNFALASGEEILNRPKAGAFLWIIVGACAIVLAVITIKLYQKLKDEKKYPLKKKEV